MMNEEEKSNICEWLSRINASAGTPNFRIFHSYSGSNRNKSVLKTTSAKVLSTFYQPLHVTPVTRHNGGFLYYCLFCIFHETKPWLTTTDYICIHPSKFTANCSISNSDWLPKISIFHCVRNQICSMINKIYGFCEDYTITSNKYLM